MRRLLFLLLFVSCADTGGGPDPLPAGTPTADDRWCTPEFAGFGGAPAIEFAHYFPRAGCTLDPEAVGATCTVAGCTVPNIETWVTSEEELAPYLSCGTGMTSGIDFAKNGVLFVRQGMRVGEWMKREPVGWVVDVSGQVIVAEKRRAFCISGSEINGGVVSYGLLLPAATASTAIERRLYRNPNGCDMCSGDSDCTE